jgi:hypothetical protein
MTAAAFESPAMDFRLVPAAVDAPAGSVPGNVPGNVYTLAGRWIGEVTPEAGRWVAYDADLARLPGRYRSAEAAATVVRRVAG